MVHHTIGRAAQACTSLAEVQPPTGMATSQNFAPRFSVQSAGNLTSRLDSHNAQSVLHAQQAKLRNVTTK